MLALHTTSNGSPEEKLGWAFRMYDVDGNGSIDFNEMKRSVTSSKYSSNLKIDSSGLFHSNIVQSGVGRVRDDGH